MLILHNATIYTLDPKQPQASAIAIDQREDNSGRVVALGSLDTLEEEFPRAKREDLQGRVVLPGLTDAHLHLHQYAILQHALDCRTKTRAECIDRVAARAEVIPPGAWILGHGWQQNDWQEGFGNAALLDAVAARNPILLTAASMHAAWVNTAALKAAGITSQTSDPANGRIERYPDGSPTGILFEAAIRLVDKAIPEPSLEENARAIEAVQADLWIHGITGVHDFDRTDCFRSLQTLRERGNLKLRVLKSIPVEELEHAIAIGLRSGFGDDILRIGGVKVFADGALGPRTAAVFEPYATEPTNRGMLFVDGEQMLEWSRKAALGGLPMSVHAIGDRANHEMLNAFAQLREFENAQGLPKLRHRIEHVQLLHPDDLHRLGHLGLVASMQPIHATSDMDIAEKYWGERVKFSYGWKTQLNAGAILAFGSDAPVESPNPWLGIHAAVTRRRADGSPGKDGWLPDQRLSVDEAIAGFTTGAAYAAGSEDKVGQLRPGYFADLIVVKKDPFAIDPNDLQHVKPQATMLGGEWVWRETGAKS